MQADLNMGAHVKGMFSDLTARTALTRLHPSIRILPNFYVAQVMNFTCLNVKRFIIRHKLQLRTNRYEQNFHLPCQQMNQNSMPVINCDRISLVFLFQSVVTKVCI